MSDEWILTDGDPKWAPPDEIRRDFSLAAWDAQLVWSDGTLHDLTFALEDIVQLQHASPAEGHSDELFVLAAIQQLHLSVLQGHTPDHSDALVDLRSRLETELELRSEDPLARARRAAAAAQKQR